MTERLSAAPRTLGGRTPRQQVTATAATHFDCRTVCPFTVSVTLRYGSLVGLWFAVFTMKPATSFTLAPFDVATLWNSCTAGSRLLSQPSQSWWAASM